MSLEKHKPEKLFQNHFISYFLPRLWLAGGYLFGIWYHIFPGKWLLDADLASEMVLANKLNEEHSILSTDWFYSTELRVFHSQWFYRLGLLVFPDNWHCARILSAVLMLAVFALLLICFTKVLGLEKYGVWCAAFMMWPFGDWYLVYGIFGTYYLIYMLFSLSVIVILMKLAAKDLMVRGEMVKHKAKIGRLLLCAAGTLISFASGLNGIKQLMVFFVPLSAALILLVFFDAREKNVSSLKELKTTCSGVFCMLISGLFFTLCSMAGYLINSFVLSKKYSFREYGSIIWASEPDRSLLDVWFDFLRLYGFQKDVKIVSFEGLAATLGLMLGAAVLISIIRLCIRYKTLTAGIKLTLLLTISTLLINGLIFSFADTDYSQYYWLPLLPFGVALLIAEIKTERFTIIYTPKVFLVSMMICVTICSFSTVKKEQESPLLPVRAGYSQIVDWLIAHGLTQGYSSFWSSAVLREMSNNTIETWTIYSGSTVYEWLQEKNHMIREPEKPYFFLYDNRLSGEREWYTMICDGSGRLIYQDDFYEIYIYE